VQKTQRELYLEVLQKLKQEGVLEDIVLIGSWCGQLYREYFKDDKYVPVIRTRDVDFLVPIPVKIKRQVDLQQILSDLGFNIVFKGRDGYISFEHPDLIIEFLVPERGRDSDKPYAIPKLGINAQPLRHLDLLSEKTVKISFGGVEVVAPHPANFALQKLLISGRRTKVEKAEKDRALAFEILKALIEAGDGASVTACYRRLPKKWQKNILAVVEQSEWAEMLSGLLAVE